MDNDPRRHARKRGNILRILKDDYPDWLTLENVYGTLDYMGKGMPIDEVRLQLELLRSKGYAETREIRGERSRQKLTEYRATAKLFDLYDGNNNVTDEGIIF